MRIVRLLIPQAENQVTHSRQDENRIYFNLTTLPVTDRLTGMKNEGKQMQHHHHCQGDTMTG